MTRLAALLLLLMSLAGPALAVLPSEELANPVLEARARHLGSELRCVVCQNETIEESDAPLAGTLRVLLRQRLEAGDTDKQAMNFIVSRYGHFVLMRPPFETDTLLLWLGPGLVLLAGGIWVATLARRGRGGAAPSSALTTEEEAALARRLEGDPV